MEWKSTAGYGYYRRFVSYTREQFSLLIRSLGCCDLCGQFCQTDLLVCDICLSDIPKLDLTRYQGDLLNNPEIHRKLTHGYFDQLVCVSRYIWPFDQWISQLKYRRRFELSKMLARTMYHHWSHAEKCDQTSRPELIIPVPLHWFKELKRSYNQAALLAHYIGRFSGIVVDDTVIKRKHYTQSQVGQSGAERRKNLKDAFALSVGARALPQHVMLVDDVVTTGTTVNEISRILKQHGVEKITVLSLTLAN